MWKDQIYADVSYTRLDEESYLRCRFVNDTDLSQNCILNIFGALEFPAPEHCALQLPGDAALVDANDYTQYTYAKPRPWDNENPDGMHKGEFADGNFYHAHGLGDRCENYHVDFLGLEPWLHCRGQSGIHTAVSPTDGRHLAVALSHSDPGCCCLYRQRRSGRIAGERQPDLLPLCPMTAQTP